MVLAMNIDWQVLSAHAHYPRDTASWTLLLTNGITLLKLWPILPTTADCA